MTEIGPENIREFIDYDPQTGDFRWLRRPSSMFKTARAAKTWNTRFAGEKIFKRERATYPSMAIFGVQYGAHRIAWLYHYGKWPEGVIDHINRNINDNRITNLRDVSQGDNTRNRGKISTNTSGYNGVYFNKSRGYWYAQIKVDGRNKHLGTFDTKEAAWDRRISAQAEYGYHTSHGVSR